MIMIRGLSIATMVMAVLTFLLLSGATGTDRWKEHLDIYKMTRKYIGLWRGCLMVEADNFAEMPEYYECDKDFLRPHRIEPPDWFIAVRVLMLLSCLATLLGIAMMAVALVTDSAKKKGSKLSPAGVVILIGGICAFMGLGIFTKYEDWNVKYVYSAGKYYAMYWEPEPANSMVNGVFFNIELWYRWSYGLGWGGAGLAVLTFLTSGLADLTRTEKFN